MNLRLPVNSSSHHPVAISLTGPWSESAVRNLRAGDYVELDGTVYTARDAVHKRLAEGQVPPLCLTEAAIYHCGPVTIRDEAGKWRVVAAGPTTSDREEPYMASLIERFRLRLIIGKGGMGGSTLQACRKYGCVYLHAVGGTAQVLAHAVQRVEAVAWLENGLPEAIWQLSVRKFPAVVTMDSHGCSLHQQIRRSSRARLRKLWRQPDR